MNTVAGTFDSAAAEYERQLQMGISLSGESADYFVEGRTAVVRDVMRDSSAVRSILDFGCGVGNAVPALLAAFPQARVSGLDVSMESLAEASQRMNARGLDASRVSWINADAELPDRHFDLVFTTGVFHHIDPKERDAELSRLSQCLRLGGRLCLFENNPWNPGTRWVMSRIPFDRDAICLSPIETRQRIRRAGLRVVEARFVFFFPRVLSKLRSLEKWLVRVPLGAQYVVVAERAQS